MVSVCSLIVSVLTATVILALWILGSLFQTGYQSHFGSKYLSWLETPALSATLMKPHQYAPEMESKDSIIDRSSQSELPDKATDKD
jgi:hypothetical protein